MCLFGVWVGCTEKTAATQRLDVKATRVSIVATNWPRSVSTTTDFVVNVTVTNVGEIFIPSLGKEKGDLLRGGVSYHWRQMDDKVVIWDGISNPLKSDLKKGDQQMLEIAVMAPPAAGKYILEIDLVQNSAFWFSSAGSQTARMTIDVI